MKISKDKSRLPILDAIKGFTVLLMFFFHGAFDLNHFSLIQINILRAPFWYFLPRLIVFLFFFAVGVSLKLVHNDKIIWSHFNKRFFKLSFFSLIISIVTKILFPENWIYFGTLHSIAVISIFALPFINYPKFSLFISFALFIPSIIWDKTLPWFELPIQSFDYISPFPWLGAALLGIYAAHKNIHKIPISDNKLSRSLNYLGRNSLVIYLLHQPILFGLTFLLFKIKS